MAEPAHGTTAADASPPELPAAADGAELDGAAVPLPPEDPWHQGQDPWSGVSLNASGSEPGKGTEKGSVPAVGSFVDPELQRQKGKGKGGKEKGGKGGSLQTPMAVDATFPMSSSFPHSMPPTPWTAPVPTSPESSGGMTTPWSQPQIYASGLGHMGQPPQGFVPPAVPMPPRSMFSRITTMGDAWFCMATWTSTGRSTSRSQFQWFMV